MTTDCGRFEPLLSAYADDALEAFDRGTVEQHLRQCAACRLDVAGQRLARQVLRARASELRESAPATLRERLSRPAVVPTDAQRPIARWRAVPLPAAAALVIALAGVVAFGALAPRGTVMAAQLTLDHVKCLLLTGRRGAADASSLATRWKERRGWDITIPPSSEAELLELVALRRCLVTDGEMAHLVYRRDGGRVSLFVMPRVGRPAAEVAIMGYDTVTWTASHRVYALVGDLPREELSRVAGYMRARVR